MFDFHHDVTALSEMDFHGVPIPGNGSFDGVSGAKRAFDVIGCLCLLVPLAIFTLLLVVLNPLFNRGSLLFVQERMGFRCKPFAAIKFRTMTTAPGRVRGAFDGLEIERITALGSFLRKTRIDELPQIINVLRGQMSLIGPRPDQYDHACVYLRKVPGYRDRHRVVPGISGLAQVSIGYVDELEGVHRKVATDLHYIAHTTLALDLWITWRTIVVVLSQRGS